jgi:hypothetical protein
MVDRRLDDVRCDPELGHARDCRSSQIVQGPALRYLRNRVECDLPVSYAADVEDAGRRMRAR